MRELVTTADFICIAVERNHDSHDEAVTYARLDVPMLLQRRPVHAADWAPLGGAEVHLGTRVKVLPAGGALPAAGGALPAAGGALPAAGGAQPVAPQPLPPLRFMGAAIRVRGGHASVARYIVDFVEYSAAFPNGKLFCVDADGVTTSGDSQLGPYAGYAAAPQRLRELQTQGVLLFYAALPGGGGVDDDDDV